MQQNFNQIISCFSKLKEYITILGDEYKYLLEIIKKESESVGSYNICELESYVKAKQQIGAKIEDTIVASLSEGKRLKVLALIEGEQPQTLTEIADLICEIGVKYKEKYGITKEWERIIQFLLSKIKEFKLLASKSKLEIEKNKFILQRLLSNHQESLRFWQKTFTELNASYDANGHFRSDIGVSHIEVKA